MEETINPRLRILHLEDNLDDRELIRMRLNAEGLKCDIKHVQTREQFLSSIENDPIDLVLADHSLPEFDGMTALHLTKETKPEMPFVFVTGSMGEESAIETIRSGATDYVLKDRLSRLSPAIKRAVSEAREKQKSRRAFEALIESEKRFRTFMDHSSLLTYIKDEQGRFVYANRRFEKVIDLKPDEVIGKTSFDILSEQEARCVAEKDAEVFRSGEPMESTEILTDRAGRLRHWIVSRFPMEDADGRKLLGGAAREITDRLLAEEARKRSEARFAAVWKHSSDGMRLTNRAGIILAVNQAYCDLVGIAAEDLEGKSFAILYPGRDPAEIEAKHRQRFEQLEKESHLERRVTFQFGKTIDVEVTNSFVRLESEEPLLLSVFRDVTERKRSEQRIQEQAALLDKAQDAICVCDLDGTIRYWNKSAERVYGWTSAEALGRKILEVFSKSDPAPLETARQQTVEKNEWMGELLQFTKAGKTFTVQSRWTLVKDDADVPRSILIINTDITEKKELESQFLRAQRMESIGILAGGIAHDLNNVLAPILMVSQLLRMKTNDAESLEWLDTLESSTQHGADLIKQILAFARGMEGERVEMQVGHLIKDMQKILRETLTRSIAINVNVAKDLWLIKGVATHLNQVLMNLCVNARDAMPGGGRIDIAAENVMVDETYGHGHPDAKPGPYVMISVSDTGGGIPPEIMERIYDPFFTTKEIGKGTGLGLSTVKGIVKSHEGFVHVYSEVGRGTTFKIYIPATLSAEVVDTVRRKIELPHGHGECILVVDDETQVRELLKAVLEKHNYRIITANDGAEGLAIYTERQTEIRLVLSDLMMPLMEGRTMIRALKRMKPDVKIIALSGLLDPHYLEEAPELASVELMQKPFSTEKLLLSVWKALHTGH